MANGYNPQTAPNARPVEQFGVFRRVASRAVEALSYTIRGVGGPADWFGPNQPLQPVAQTPGVIGRQFDYPVGYNTRITPRLDEAISFAQMKAMADGFDVLRLIIETRKDEVAAQGWKIAPKDEDLEPDDRCAQVQEFFQRPDKYHCWDDWLRMVLEQLFVLDAVSLYLQPTRGGDLYAIQVIDGSTIKRTLTEDGRTPQPDEGPAYQEILKGLPAVDYVVPVAQGMPLPLDEFGMPMPELLYRPRNIRADKIYGYSPVEQIVTTVNIALHRQFYQLNYYTNGSTPDLIFSVPNTWNPTQITEFQYNWESMLRGNLENRRGSMFVPDGVKPFDTKEKALKDEYDEWLTRICCYAFSVSPTPFIRQMNRATAQTHQEVAVQQGLEPVLRWLSNVIGDIIALKFGWPDLGLKWEEDDPVAPTDQATIDVQLVSAKIYHPDEIRAKRGDEPMPPDMRDQMDMATFNAAANSTILPPDQQAEKDKAAQALAAAKPAPVMPAGPTPAQAKKDADEHFDRLAVLLKPLPQNITVEAPQVHVAPAAVNVTSPPVNVTLPEIKQADVFVDVGATNVVSKFEAPKKASAPQGAREVTYTQDADGNMVAKITHTTTRTIKSERDSSGKLIAKVEG